MVQGMPVASENNLPISRRYWVTIHRWAGLAMAGLLLVVGITGSLLAFYPELERLINPRFYPAGSYCAPLGLGELAERAAALEPAGQVNGVLLEANQGATLALLGPRPGVAQSPPDNMFLDPCSGEELARRRFGSIADGWVNFISFVYQLHYALALGNIGTWILGICALLWTIDCLVSAYLTFPARSRKPLLPLSKKNKSKHRSWWQRWKPSWKIRWGANGYKVNFDLHRAGGLWLWFALLVFAWSSVFMNLSDTVYTWTTRAVFEYREPWTELPPRSQPLITPRLTWREAQAVGEQIINEQSKSHGFSVERPIALRLDRARGVYIYAVRSSLDIQDKRGRTRVFFDADTGEFRLLLLPTGQYAGNTATSWLFALHEANIFGLPYRIFVCLLGLAIVMLSVTGVVIWLKKLRARKLKRRHGVAKEAMPVSAHS